jgi:phosphomevalonate kinase
MKTTVVSAPGKVLLAGGYLVLDPEYSGLVVATSSRFYTLVRSSGSILGVRVRSPQFINAEWNYQVDQQGEIHPDQRYFYAKRLINSSQPFQVHRKTNLLS